MQYKRLGKTELKISRLGFGAMRLPTRADGKLDEEESIRIIHRAFELGVNYIDTAVMYGNFQSQAVVGKALKGWRDKVYLSTKNHYRGADEKAWWKNLEDSLRLIDVDYIDIYNIHGVNWNDWEKWFNVPNGIMTWMHKAQDQGLIRHICCSFHDNAEALKKIAETDAFCSVTLQYNLLDRSLEPAFETCAEHDMGIIAMGPVGGGRLGGNSELFQKLVPGAGSTAEAAMRFVLANPYVTAGLSGMGTMAMVEENCAVASREDALSEEEKVQIETQLEKLKGLAELYCTGCDYCMPCQSGVEIARNFTAVNTAKVYGLQEHAQAIYNGLTGKAFYCFACGKCEPKCPQNIPIRVQLLEAVKMFDPHYGQMCLDLSPVRLEDGELEVRARCHNLGNDEGKATVRFKEEAGVSISPAHLEFEVEEAMRRRNQTLTIASAEATGLNLAFEVEDSTGSRTETAAFTFASCYNVASMEELYEKSMSLAPITIDRPEQLIVGDSAQGHTLPVRAWPGYTEENFLLYLEIDQQGDLPEGPNGPARWFIDFILDLRNREDELAPGYGQSMFLLRTPLEGEESGAHVLRGNLEPAKVALSRKKNGTMTEIRIEIPWELLAETEDMDERGFEPGEAFGFDMTILGLNDIQQPVYMSAWNGRSRQNNEARTGTLFFKE